MPRGRALRGLVAAVVATVGVSVLVPTAGSATGGPLVAPAAGTASATPGPVPARSELPAEARTALAIGAHAELAVRPAQRISRIATRKKVAYLTFDDGPDPRWTPQVTKVLRKHKVKGTFFVVGNASQRHPRMVRTLRSQGHVVANHSYSHPVLTRQSSSAVRSQLQRTDRAIGSSRCYRAPYGSVNRRVDTVAGSLGTRYSVLWNVDSNDWRRPGATTIANTVVRTTRPGSIILMHDGGGNRSQTVAALDQSITRLKKQGYTFKPLTQCGRR